MQHSVASVARVGKRAHAEGATRKGNNSDSHPWRK
jgi:hypothetical protein